VRVCVCACACACAAVVLRARNVCVCVCAHNKKRKIILSLSRPCMYVTMERCATMSRPDVRCVRTTQADTHRCIIFVDDSIWGPGPSSWPLPAQSHDGKGKTGDDQPEGFCAQPTSNDSQKPLRRPVLGEWWVSRPGMLQGSANHVVVGPWVISTHGVPCSVRRARLLVLLQEPA
jgi:hypothetical protein